MRAPEVANSLSEIHLRPGDAGDVDALVDLENSVFATDRLSRRGFRRLLTSPTAELIVATQENKLAGYALVFFRPNSSVARLYSIAVAPHASRRGVGPLLLTAAEEAASRRECTHLRLEVHEGNARAIARYRKSGYDLFGRHLDYYDDHGNALRFEKRLESPRRSSQTPPYFHQTTEFTCGPACMMMALAWADPSWRPAPAFELRLWREATTIAMASGPGGCEPYGIAVTLKRHGLLPEIHVSRPGPYFLDTTRSQDKRRVMRLAQAEFHREAGELGIPAHLTPLGESAFIQTLDAGAAALVLVSGYHMVRRGIPHWVFAFGHEGRYVLVHDPAAKRDEKGAMLGPETYAVPWTKFERMMRVGSENLRAAVVVRKGSRQ
jgi:ribosomal protein S18 acetylase RimI-like enzyme